MDLSNFKLLKEDADSYEIGHPSGRKLTVSKSGLSAKAHAAIKKYADGGEVTPDAPSAIDNNLSSISNAASGLKDTLSPLVSGTNPDAKLSDAFNLAAANTAQMAEAENSRAPASAAPSAPTDPTPSGVQTGEVGPTQQAIGQAAAVKQQAEVDPLLQQTVSTASLLEKQEKQINDYTKATMQLNNQTAKFYKDYNDQAEKMQTPEQIVEGYKAKDDALLKAYTDNKIDPNRFYKNQSTGSRVASAIGLILSGAGSGVTGGPNLAMQQLNKAVDADIEAQKNEQGKNLSLFQMNRQALGDDLKAQAATQNQLFTGVQAKVAMATAMAQNPAVKLKGQEMINEIEAKKIQNRLQMGILNQGAGQQQPGAAPGTPTLSKADPAVLVPMFIKDPAQQKEAYAEIQKAQDASKSYTEMLEQFDRAAKENTILRTGGVRTPVSISRLENLGLPLIRDQVGRVSEFEHDAFKALNPKIGDTDAKIAQKRQGMIDFWRSKMSAPTAKGASNGAIDLSKFSSTALPLPAETSTMGGEQYVKVPGGWKKVSAR